MHWYVVVCTIVSTSLSLDPLSYDVIFRLPDQLQPLSPFSASLNLHFLLPQSSSFIYLHSVGLSNFRNITLVGMDGKERLLKGIRICSDHVQFVFDYLIRGQYILHIGEYTGEMNDGSTAMFLRGASLYTHLQPSFARRILPCIDDPSVRAPFKLTIEHSNSTIAFSNTGIVEERSMNGRKISSFGVTPSLPSYLIAFSIIPQSLLQISGQTSFGVTIRVIGYHNQTLLRILRASLSSIEYLADLFRIPLPLNKLDIVLVDSYEGGMENWGHILISSSLAQSADQAHLIHLVSHEIAHHWIGNAVTVFSWTHICLQEDLTELYAHKTVKKLLPLEDYQRFRVSKYVEIQLAEDEVSPLESLILPQDITTQMISTHCYLKGVTHLEKIESIVGEEYMLDMIRSIITDNSPFDLHSFTSHLNSFHLDNNITLSDIYYHSFTSGGYPTIQVSLTPSSISIHQSSSNLWPLHLNFRNGSNQWMFASSSVYERNKECSPLDNLINIDFTSFVRVNYDTHTWTSILDQLQSNTSSFSPVARAQLISDLCFFSNGFVDNHLVERAISIVYSNPEEFDLCDWTLLWCRNSQQLTASSLLQRVLVNISSLFTSASDYKCRSGEAIQSVNQFCKTVFGKECI